MKALFFIICLLNIIFFAWEFHQGALNPPPQQQTTLPTILLADELENARRGAIISGYLDNQSSVLDKLRFELPQAPTVLKLPPVEPKKHRVAETHPILCYEAGPFADQQAASAWLVAQNLYGELFYKETSSPSAYLVYYPAARKPEQMRINKLMLNAKGINDIWIVPSGDLKGALSLGMFNDLPHAEALKKQLLQRGVQAEIKERYRSQSQLFTRVKSDRETLSQQIENLKQVSCE